MNEAIKPAIESVATFIEVVGVLVICIGLSLTLLRFLFGFARKRSPSYHDLRQGMGKSILVGLEILVAADIILTVATDLSFEKVATLGLVIVVRTLLSFSLEVELDGKLPWRKFS